MAIALVGLFLHFDAAAVERNRPPRGEWFVKALGAFSSRDRPEWDQGEAEARVAELMAQEERGDFAWETIAWETDAELAAARAEQEKKPIFVYLYLKGEVGPPEAPC